MHAMICVCCDRARGVLGAESYVCFLVLETRLYSVLLLESVRSEDQPEPTE